MERSPSERDPFDRLAEEFALRVRRGERPPLAEYIDRHPELADAALLDEVAWHRVAGPAPRDSAEEILPLILAAMEILPPADLLQDPGRRPLPARPPSRRYRLLRTQP